MCRVEFFKIGKRDVTFIRETRVVLIYFVPNSNCSKIFILSLKLKMQSFLGSLSCKKVRIQEVWLKVNITKEYTILYEEFVRSESRIPTGIFHGIGYWF